MKFLIIIYLSKQDELLKQELKQLELKLNVEKYLLFVYHRTKIYYNII
jgi:hypothetical protein